MRRGSASRLSEAGRDVAIDPAIADFLREYGLPLTMLLVFGIAIVRGWFVAGFVYRREVERGDAATIALLEALRAARGGARHGDQHGATDA